MHLASGGAYNEVVETLIKNSASCDIEDSFGNKPVYYAGRSRPVSLYGSDYAGRSRAVSLVDSIFGRCDTVAIFENSSEIVARAAEHRALAEGDCTIWAC